MHERHTWAKLRDAASIAAFLGGKAAYRGTTTDSDWSVFERTLARGRNPDAGRLDLLFACPVSRGEAVMDQLGQWRP